MPGLALKFLSTPSARRATQRSGNADGRHGISIHALREEGDPFRDRQVNGFDVISIHALREEGDCSRRIKPPAEKISIHALREEGDRGAAQRNRMEEYFYPRPPRGGRLYGRSDRGHCKPISIHALREEGDKPFLSSESGILPISIHALREEGDGFSCPDKGPLHISIHALREEGDGSSTASSAP